MNKNFRAVLLTILTLSAFVIALVELTGVSRNAIFNPNRGNGGEGTFYDKSGQVYKGEIYPEQTKSRDEMVSEMPKTTMQFYETKFSFGSISEGDVVKHNFRFKNTGKNPLMIAKADVTCGCTVPTFSKEAIAPGSDGEITIEYNSHGHTGHQQKNIIIHSNAQPEAVSIGFDAEVK